MRSVSGKVAAMTGAGSGIGRALAMELARRRCELALSDVHVERLAETVALCEALGARVTSTRLDVSSREAVFAWAESVAQAHGRVNLVFNNAGVGLAAAAETVSLQDFEWIMNINFWGVIHGTQAFLPYLKSSGDGHVINTSSLFGIIAMPTQSAYNASKFAVRGFSEALRMELELSGAPVSVTTVHPGGVATNIATDARVDAGIITLTGQTVDAHRRQSNRMISVNTPEAAAREILAAVEKNARRVLVGADARRTDRLARLLGSYYQVMVMRFVRKSRMRASMKAG